MSSRRQTIDRPVVAPNWGRSSFYALIDRLALISEGRYWAYFLLIPSMILLLAIIVYPIGSGILLSFRTMRLTRPDLGTPFIGLQHYADLMRDPVFRLAARNTVIWVVLGASSQFVVGLITALALNRKVRGIWLIRILVLVPWFLPSVVAGHIWALMLDPRLGVINDLLVKVGILDQYRSWFSNPVTSLPTVLTVDLWRSFPYFSLFLLAGLQAIPEELYEAASVDGAGYWQRFRQITMPLLAPVIVATVVLRVIGLVNSPDLLIVLTNGGPGNSTQVLSLFAFQTAYTAFNFGYAAAISVVILLLLMAFTVVYVRVSGAAKG
ncbi:MAG TPA: sugar ABC transporter permease [Thermomicrobiales bacterium]|jgi:multiple sugar transport system permease protein